MGGIWPAGEREGYLGEVMAEERKLTDKEIEKCVQHALISCSRSESKHQLRFVDEKNIIQEQELLLHHIDLAAYVSQFSQKKFKILSIPKPQQHPIGEIVIRNCYIENGSTTASNGALLYFENCLIKNISKYPNVEARDCDIGTITATSLRIRNSYVESILILEVSSALVIEESFVDKFNLSSQTRLNGPVIFSGVTFKQTPNYAEKFTFPTRNIELTDVRFTDLNSAKALAAYRSMKKTCADADYEHGVILFHGLELETYYNTILSKIGWLQLTNPLWPEKVASKFHKWFTNYGQNMMKPFYFLTFLLGIGLVINWFDVKADDFILLSFKNSLGPLILALPEETRKLHAEGWLGHTYSFIQIALSSLIWFLIIFMIRRRFKI